MDHAKKLKKTPGTAANKKSKNTKFDRNKNKLSMTAKTKKKSRENQEDSDSPSERANPAEEVLAVEPAAPSVEVEPKRHRQFVQLLHKCCAENNQAQSLEMNVFRSFLAKVEKIKPFNNVEIDVCLDKMDYENRVMRNNDEVFLI